MRTIVTASALAFAVAVVAAQATADYRGRNLRQGLGEVIESVLLSTDPSFEIEHELQGEVWGLLSVYISITDADEISTRFQPNFSS